MSIKRNKQIKGLKYYKKKLLKNLEMCFLSTCWVLVFMHRILKKERKILRILKDLRFKSVP